MTRLLTSLAAAALTLAALAPAVAQAQDEPVVIKTATLAPEGSTWYKALAAMGEEWSQITNGQVSLKIYAGGVTGNETVMMRKMRIGQLQASAITNLGLIDIDPAAQVIETPMLIRTNGELDHVMETMGPIFDERIEQNGFKVIAWGDVGWVHLFSRDPLTNPDDIGRLKIFAWEGDPAAVKMYRAAGFKPVVVAATDILPALQSGMLDSYPAPPLGALAMQWFATTPNMLDMNWAPLMGANVVTMEAWNRIPERYHEPLLEAARRQGDATKDKVRRYDVAAVRKMQEYGLQVNEIDEATEARWIERAESIYPIMRDEIVRDGAIFDQVVELVNEYRAAHP